MTTLPNTEVAELTPQGTRPLSRSIKFKWLTGDIDYHEYGGKWYSNTLGKGRFDENEETEKAEMCYVMEIINMHYATGETDINKYNVAIHAVAPHLLSDEQKESACKSACEETPFDELDWNYQVELAYEHGISAPVFNIGGNNYKKLLAEAKTEIQREDFLFGFMMDRPVNAIGNTGWDAIKGEIGFEYL